MAYYCFLRAPLYALKLNRYEKTKPMAREEYRTVDKRGRAALNSPSGKVVLLVFRISSWAGWGWWAHPKICQRIHWCPWWDILRVDPTYGQRMVGPTVDLLRQVWPTVPHWTQINQQKRQLIFIICIRMLWNIKRVRISLFVSKKKIPGKCGG